MIALPLVSCLFIIGIFLSALMYNYSISEKHASLERAATRVSEMTEDLFYKQLSDMNVSVKDRRNEKSSLEQKDQSDSFFEENALIITKMITRGSGSIKLTVNNLYVSDDTVYIVIRTDEPTMGTGDMQYAFFGFAVAKNDVVNVDKVVTLE